MAYFLGAILVLRISIIAASKRLCARVAEE